MVELSWLLPPPGGQKMIGENLGMGGVIRVLSALPGSPARNRLGDLYWADPLRMRRT